MVLGEAGLFRYRDMTSRPKYWHQLAYTYIASPEHVDPGTADPSRWTTSCWACNGAKGSVPPEDLGWTWDASPPDAGWDGLSGSLGALRERLRALVPQSA